MLTELEVKQNRQNAKNYRSAWIFLVFGLVSCGLTIVQIGDFLMLVFGICLVIWGGLGVLLHRRVQSLRRSIKMDMLEEDRHVAQYHIAKVQRWYNRWILFSNLALFLLFVDMAYQLITGGYERTFKRCIADLFGLIGFGYLLYQQLWLMIKIKQF